MDDESFPPHEASSGTTQPPGESAKREDFEPGRQEQREKLNALRQTAFERERKAPTKAEMERRRSRLNLAKWLLPSLAGIFLVSIAAWPEVTHLLHQNRAILHELGLLKLESGHMDHAIYRDIDSHGRPYMLTADIAHQMDADRIDLDRPEGDMLLSPNQWFHIRADHGVYLQHEQTLDLDGHVVLYRSDGVLLNTPSADLDLKRGIAATHDWVHAEGPFGTQDAQGAFLDQNAGLIQFMGPGLTNRFDDVSETGSPLSIGPKRKLAPEKRLSGQKDADFPPAPSSSGRQKKP